MSCAMIMAQDSSTLHMGSSLLIPILAFWKVTHWIGLNSPSRYIGKVSCQDSTVSMPVSQTRAFWSKQRRFWVKFGYVVLEIKYTPKLVELIKYNGYGMVMT